jgi:hypothetical protein
MNANNSYQERNSVPNIAEDLFIKYMTEKGYKLQRFGFDEKNDPIDGFFKTHQFIRSIPDFVWLDKRKAKYVMTYFHVKGSNKLKVSDLINYTLFEDLFMKEGVVKYVFMHDESGPIFKSMKEIRQAMTGKIICEWHDGNQYIPLQF